MNKKAFSLLEVILAAAIFVIFSSGAITAILSGINLNRAGNEYTIATQYASEGIEAVRSIKNQAFANLVNTVGTGITQTGGVWTFSGTNNVFDKYTRTIAISDVYRDGLNNIVATGGTLDPLSKKITSTVTYNFGPGKNNTVSTQSYFTNWKVPLGKGGLLVYGNGGVLNDAMVYKTIDVSGVWSAPASTADVDGASTNKYARAIKVYSSPTRNEKILVSRHYNGTNQFIYAQVFNGTTWGNVIRLSNWTASTFLDVQNFDGTYLANGNFMVTYSDNTTTPKFRTWNGTAWSARRAMRILLGIPRHIEIEQRPATNEVMAAFLDSANDTNTEYFNGTTWSARTSHAANTVSAGTKRALGFSWSTNTPTTGALIYTTANNDRKFNAKIFVANGAGSGAWGAIKSTANLPNNMGSLKIASRPGANEFLSCTKDGKATPTIVCRKLTFVGNVATWTTPVNPIVAAATDTGIQASFDISYGTTQAVITYGDNTNIPKYKVFNPVTATITAVGTAISTAPYTLLSPVRTVRSVLDPNNSSTTMTLFTDSNLDLYSSTPITQHGITGSAITDYWYDFAWNLF